MGEVEVGRGDLLGVGVEGEAMRRGDARLLMLLMFDKRPAEADRDKATLPFHAVSSHHTHIHPATGQR